MSNNLKIAFLLSIVIVVIVSYRNNHKAPQIAVLEQPKQEIRLLPGLIPICACESTGSATGKPTHWNKDGTVKHGKINPQDIGMCQINERWNGKTAEKMGLNIYKEQDSIIFANYLYTTRGSQPWNWSKPCWGKHTK